jgi:molybdopterin-guanine dinucleotide biosynthesis protein A
MQLSAVILAGGQSTRMGRDKAWVRYQGLPLVEAALEKVRSLGIQEAFISARFDQDFSLLRCRVLVDGEVGFGPMSGIEHALRASNAPLLLVLPVDLPGMTAGCLRKLIACCDRLTGAVAKLGSRLEPLVAVYPTRCYEYARMNIARGDYAVQGFAAACLHEHAVRLFRVPDGFASCFTNCNTPEDLARLDLRSRQPLNGN